MKEKIIKILFILFSLSISLSIGLTWLFHSILLLILIFKLFTQKKWEKTSLDYFLLIYLLSQIIPVFFSPYPEETLNDWGKLFIFTSFYITTQLIKKEHFKSILFFFIVGATLSSLYGSIKFIFGLTERATGFTGGWGTLAYQATFAAIFSFIFLIENKNWYYLFPFIINLFGLLSSLTRANLGSLILCIFIYLIFFKRQIFIYFLVSISIIFLISPQKIKKRWVNTLKQKGDWTSGRIEIWKTGLKLFKKKPLTGWGRHTIRKVIPEEAWEKIHDRGIGNWHNEWIQNLLDSGVIGFLCWLLLLIVFFKNYFLFSVKIYPQDYIPFLLFLGSLSFLFISFFGSINSALLAARMNYMLWGMLAIYKKK